ncbi:hypothetical protein BCR35DRAFT_331290 [Leucosporidium creatinivorum]|uniref:Uncharacterized protein n=1 Tax=Leucosporidium creatinivorum TaxID=106004 RepID=A0A1Y2FG57_9BASI|nr:hypothetical protein BCR35DRAFT_336412 [Leucosporidium creatinivorum]ORY82911.1 hypothetical protein BCR35DRAFT_331290 [Leucosporidium creatinivorum]
MVLVYRYRYTQNCYWYTGTGTVTINGFDMLYFALTRGSPHQGSLCSTSVPAGDTCLWQVPAWQVTGTGSWATDSWIFSKWAVFLAGTCETGHLPIMLYVSLPHLIAPSPLFPN